MRFYSFWSREIGQSLTSHLQDWYQADMHVSSSLGGLRRYVLLISKIQIGPWIDPISWYWVLSPFQKMYMIWVNSKTDFSLPLTRLLSSSFNKSNMKTSGRGLKKPWWRVGSTYGSIRRFVVVWHKEKNFHESWVHTSFRLPPDRFTEISVYTFMKLQGH